MCMFLTFVTHWVLHKLCTYDLCRKGQDLRCTSLDVINQDCFLSKLPQVNHNAIQEGKESNPPLSLAGTE